MSSRETSSRSRKPRTDRSGAGIGDLYDFARQQAGTPEPVWLAQEIATGDRNAVVSKAALGVPQADPVCAHALETRWPHPIEGLVVTRYGYGEACRKIAGERG